MTSNSLTSPRASSALAADLRVPSVLGLLVVPALVAQAVKHSTPWQYRTLFVQYGFPTGDENLLHALGWRETNLNPALISPPNTNGTRDYGLMQINSANFAKLGVTASSVMDPETNVRCAITVIGWSRTKGIIRAADLASIYNAGSNADGTARHTADGKSYVNPDYVRDVTLKMVQVQIAALALV